MSIKMSNFKLGMFIISGTALLVVLIVMFGAGVFSGKGPVIETYIDASVDGLNVGSPLKYRGVRIGRVTSIGLVEQFYPEASADLARCVLIRMELDPQRRVSDKELEQRIVSWVNSGMRLRNASQGLTGVGFMEADFVKSGQDTPLAINWKPKVLYVPSTRTQLARVVDTIEAVARDLHDANIPQLAGKVDKLLVTLDTVVADVDLKTLSKQVGDALEHIETVAASINEITSDPGLKGIGTRAASTLDELNLTLGESRTAIHELSAELDATLKEAHATVTDVRSRVTGAQINGTLERLSQSAQRIDTALTEVESAFARKDEQVDLIISDLRAVSASMRDMTRLLSQYPSLAAFGESPSPSEVYKNE